MLKKMFLSKNYLEATENEKKMMWLNFFVLLFCYAGGMLTIVSKSKR